MKNNFLLLLNFGPISAENVIKTYEINRNIKQNKEFNAFMKNIRIGVRMLVIRGVMQTAETHYLCYYYYIT